MSYVWFTIPWIHLLAMAFFVGGQMLLAAVVVPVERRAPIASGCEPSRDALARALAAFAVLIATGTAMTFHSDLWGDHTLQAKLGPVVLVIALVLLRMRRPALHLLEAATFVVSLAIVWLGLNLANGHT